MKSHPRYGKPLSPEELKKPRPEPTEALKKLGKQATKEWFGEDLPPSKERGLLPEP